MGGVYRDQGQQAVSKWLNPLLKSRVETAYQDLHKHYHPTPESISLLQPSTPPSRYSSPGVSSASPNHPAENPVATRPESTGDRSNRRRRRPSSSREGGIRNGGRQGTCSSMRSYRTDLIFDAGCNGSWCTEGRRSRPRWSSGPDANESARKRARSSGPDAI